MALPDDPQQQLDWEARQRPAPPSRRRSPRAHHRRQLFRGAAFRDAPRADVLDAFDRLQQPGPVEQQPSLQIEVAQFLDERVMSFVLPSIAEGLGYFALAYALTFLAAATRARRQQFPKIALYLPAIGGVLMGVVSIVGAVGLVTDRNEFLDGPRTVEAAQDIGYGSVSVAAQVLLLPAALAIGDGVRAGLAQRDARRPADAVPRDPRRDRRHAGDHPARPVPGRADVLAARARVLFAGRRPGGDPPAWRTGREEPWPSQQEMAEQRAQQAAGAPRRRRPRRRRRRGGDRAAGHRGRRTRRPRSASASAAADGSAAARSAGRRRARGRRRRLDAARRSPSTRGRAAA